MIYNSRKYLSFEAKIVTIENRHSKQLKGKIISMVKVMCHDKSGSATWELEETIRETYPYHFFVKSIFEDENFLVGENVRT